ncbi:MAG: TetR family transcriptional regulator [Planctomycetota bacterium]
MRTRKDLLLAAARLLKNGQSPNMSEVAEEAQVSRATAYRYFANVDALLCEAPVDEDVPDPSDVFARDRSVDPEKRVAKAEAALHASAYRNNARLRAMLAYTLKQSLEAGASGIPVRQNRRTPLIEKALEPARDRLRPATYKRLCAALALVFGTESMIVFEDVLRIDEREARAVKAWALRQMVRGALDESRRAHRE